MTKKSIALTITLAGVASTFRLQPVNGLAFSYNTGQRYMAEPLQD